jgi:hypothetical protein
MILSHTKYYCKCISYGVSELDARIATMAILIGLNSINICKCKYIECFKQLSKINPKDEETFSYLGVSSERLNHHNEATVNYHLDNVCIVLHFLIFIFIFVNLISFRGFM